MDLDSEIHHLRHLLQRKILLYLMLNQLHQFRLLVGFLDFLLRQLHHRHHRSILLGVLHLQYHHYFLEGDLLEVYFLLLQQHMQLHLHRLILQRVLLRHSFYHRHHHLLM